MAPKSPLTKALKGNQGKLPQHLQEAIKAAPESPAKAMMGPDVPKEAGKTGTAGANSAKGVNAKKPEFKGSAKMDDAMMGPKAKATAPKAKAKPKWDKELNSLVASRKGLKKGTAEYNKVQNRINEKLGSGVRRREEETTKLKPKSGDSYSKNTRVEPTAKKPAAKKAPSQADKFENALAKENAKAPMGSETRSKAPAAKKPAAKKPVAKKPAAQKNSPRVTQTANRATVVTKSNGVKKKETVNKNTGNKKVVVKDANTRTVTKTNKAGESTTKTTKRIGKGRIKGAIKDARLARLDKKATRQAAKAADKKSKGAGKLSGLGK